MLEECLLDCQVQMIELNIKGHKVLMDEDVAADINPALWECRTIRNMPYFRTVSRIGGKRKTVWLHRVIAMCPANKVVDHINGNWLDNRRANLRICSVAENARNRRKGVNNKSGYKGVYKNKRNKAKPWHAQIWRDGVRCHLGYFQTVQEAALAYNEAAKLAYGEFANLNTLEV